jgi:hypothetical protein
MKHQVFDRIEEKSGFWKKWMSLFAKSDSSVFGRCTVRQSILLNEVQQNRMFWFLKPESLEFLGS